MSHNVRELKIWQRAMDLTVEVYKATANFPKEEMFGLTSQIRRCAVSVPSNIAEGAGRNGKGEFKHFLGISNGSSCELMTQVELSTRLKLMDASIAEKILKEIDEVQKMTRVFSSKLQ